MVSTYGITMQSSSKFIVLTRPHEESYELKKKLESLNIPVFVFSTIFIKKNQLTSTMINELKNICQFDWILFTSKNGVIYFLEELQTLGINYKVINKIHLGAVGPRTKEELEKFGLPVHIIPSVFTTDELGKTIKNVKGKKILLPRSDRANPILTKILTKKGAIVTDIPIYKTNIITKENKEFIEIIKNNQITYITFTSPSTVEGFMQSISKKYHDQLFQIPVLSIGPVTTKTAEKCGFKHILTAENHTTDGMLRKLKEDIL